MVVQPTNRVTDIATSVANKQLKLDTHMTSMVKNGVRAYDDAYDYDEYCMCTICMYLNQLSYTACSAANDVCLKFICSEQN